MTQTLFTYAQAKPLAVTAAALLAILALRWAWRVVCAERRRLGLARFLFGAAISLLVVCHVGGKTNSPPRSAYVTPTEGDIDPYAGSTNAPAVTGLSIAAIWRGSNSTDLVVAWLPSSRPLHSLVYVYSATNLVDWGWSKPLLAYVGAFASNAVVSVADDMVAPGAPSNAAPAAAFFAAGDAADSDLDGAPDADERFLHRTDPREPDTDGDGFCDGWEVSHALLGYDPLVYDSTNSLSAWDDIDNDGLANIHEQMLGTSPTDPDTDDDEIPDGTEVPVAALQAQFDQLMALYQNPVRSQTPPAWFVLPVLDACTNPLSTENTGYATAAFYFGDPSTSHSEKYALSVTPVAGTGVGEPPEPEVLLNPVYGVCDVFLAFLEKGWRYDVAFEHVSTDSAYEGDPDPDYGLLGASGPACVAFDDPDSLFGVSNVTNGVFEGEGKDASLTVYDVDVSVCSPDDDGWGELDESRVVLDDEPLRIRICVRPSIPSLAEVKARFGQALTLATSGTRPGGVGIQIAADAWFAVTNGASEIRLSLTRAQLGNLGLLPAQDDDGVDEKVAMDIVENKPDTVQSLDDGLAFMATSQAAFRGWATREAGLNLYDTPPVSEPTNSFFRAAGCEIVSASYGGSASDLRQIMNQADIFYFSGHGSHRHNKLQGGLTPETVGGYWGRDLDCVAISGCSVLDINDYNNNYTNEQEHALSPGEAWEAVGPPVLLGYNHYAPGDSSGVTQWIVERWLADRAAKGDVAAWMEANAARRAWNACAIVKGQKYVYFSKKRGFKRRQCISVNKEDW